MYLNVDCAVQGVGFNVATTPQLDKLLIDITKKVSLVVAEIYYLEKYLVCGRCSKGSHYMKNSTFTVFLKEISIAILQKLVLHRIVLFCQ